MKIYTLPILILLFAWNIYSNIIEVCPSGDRQFSDLQAALDAAVHNDTIRVYPGTYTGPFTMNRSINLTLESLYATTWNTTYIHTTKLTAPFPEFILSFNASVPSGWKITVNGFSISNDLGHATSAAMGIPTNCIAIWLRRFNADIKNNIITNHHGARLGSAVLVSSTSNNPRTVYLENNQIFNNVSLATSAGLRIGDEITAIFSQDKRNSIYGNISGSNKDIYFSNIKMDTHVYLDKGSRIITEPDGNYIGHYRSNYVPNVTVDILQESLPPFVNHDLYIAPWGDDSNTGLSSATPLRSLYLASSIIASDPQNPKAIYLAPGTYTPIVGEIPSIFLPDWVKLVGAGMDETVFDGFYWGLVLYNSPDAEIEIRDFSVINSESTPLNHYITDGEAKKASFSNIRVVNHSGSMIFCQVITTLRAATAGFNNRSSHHKNIIIQNSRGNPIHSSAINSVNIENMVIDNMRDYDWRGITHNVLYSPNILANNISYTNSSSRNNSSLLTTLFNLNINPEYTGTAIYNNVLIANNDAYDVTGFASICTAATGRYYGETILNNWTIAHNKGIGVSAALGIGGSGATINNMILYNPELPYELLISPSDIINEVIVNNSLIMDNRIVVQGGQPAPVLNDVIFEPPQFAGHLNKALTPDMWEYYFLHHTSPAIDAGLDVSEWMPLETDLAGNPRTFGSAVDMGVFEFQGVSANFDSKPKTGYAPLEVYFVCLSSGAFSWAWDFDGDGVIDSTEQNPVFVYEKAGIYSVSLTINAGESSILKTDFIVVEKEDIAVANFSAEPQTGYAPLEVQFTCQSIGATEWAWDFDGDVVIDSTEQNPVFVYEESGTFSVTLTINDGQSSITKSNFIDVKVSETDEPVLPFAGHNLQNYPNPVNISRISNTMISFDTKEKPINEPIIEIYNIRGQKVRTLNTGMSFYDLAVRAGIAQENLDMITSRNYTVTWDMRDENRHPVGTGMYFYRAVVDGQTIGTNRMMVIK